MSACPCNPMLCFLHACTLHSSSHRRLYFAATSTLSLHTITATLIYTQTLLCWSFSSFILSRSYTDPVLNLCFPPIHLSLMKLCNPAHLLNPALSWGLINLLKSQSAFHSITLILFDTFFSMLGGIRMITFTIQSLFCYDFIVLFPRYNDVMVGGTPLAQVRKNWIITQKFRGSRIQSERTVGGWRISWGGNKLLWSQGGEIEKERSGREIADTGRKKEEVKKDRQSNWRLWEKRRTALQENKDKGWEKVLGHRQRHSQAKGRKRQVWAS